LSNFSEVVQVTTSDVDSTYTIDVVDEAGNPGSCQEIYLETGNLPDVVSGELQYHSQVLYQFISGFSWDQSIDGPIDHISYCYDLKFLDSHICLDPVDETIQLPGTQFPTLGMRQIVDGTPHYYLNFGSNTSHIPLNWGTTDRHTIDSRWQRMHGVYITEKSSAEDDTATYEYAQGGCSTGPSIGAPVCEEYSYPSIDGGPISFAMAFQQGLGAGFPETFRPAWQRFRIDNFCIKIVRKGVTKKAKGNGFIFVTGGT
jgi:hypothetical protein